MWDNIATAMPEARALAKTFPETVVHKDAAVPLRSRRGRLVYKRMKSHTFDSPTGLALRWFTIKTIASHWFRKPDPANVAQPEVEFGKGDANWWRVPKFDSALVSAADGSGKNIYTRDRAQFRRMLVDSIVLHSRIKREWPKLQRAYRDALPELTSQEAWQDYLGTRR